MLRHALRTAAGAILTLVLVGTAHAHLKSQCSSFFWLDPDGAPHETENCNVPGTPSYGWQLYATDSNDVNQCYDYRAPYCEYAENPSTPPPDSCGDERDDLIAEYASAGVNYRPFCTSFTQSVPTQSQYDFGSSRQGGTWSVDDDYSWAILKDTVTANLYCIVGNYGSTPTMTSGYRNPSRNLIIDSGAPNSRHVYGDAADLQTPASPDNTMYDTLRTIAKGGACGSACVEPRSISGSHFHADYRGGCPANW